MEVWILCRQLPYESMNIVDVFDSEEKAEAYKKRCLSGEIDEYCSKYIKETPENWTIEEWDVK